MQEPEIIRITRKQEEEMIRICKEVQRRTSDPEESRAFVKFQERGHIPTIRELEDHHVAEKMRKYLPYLIFYREPEVFDSDSPDLPLLREYIDRLFAEYVDYVDEEDVSGIEELTPAVWLKMPLEERAKVFYPLISYYGFNEFDTFRKDLGFQPFMKAYETTKRKMKKGHIPSAMLLDLRAVWDYVQDPARTAEDFM